MAEGGYVSRVRVAATLTLLVLAVQGGARLATDQHGCRGLCHAMLGLNATEAQQVSMEPLSRNAAQSLGAPRTNWLPHT